MHDAQERDRGTYHNESLNFQLTAKRQIHFLKKEDEKYIEDLSTLQTFVCQ